MASIIIIIVIASLVIVEAAARFFYPSRPKVSDLDPLLGWKPRPSLTFRNESCGGIAVSFNAVGYRDGAHTLRKPDDTYRVAIIGNCIVEAREVELEKTFWKLLEKNLPQIGSKKVEVISFGVNGYSTSQELLTLETKVKDYNVDFVICVFFNGTDFEGNVFELIRHKMRPYYKVVDGKPVLSSMFGDDPNFFSLNIKSKLTAFFYDHLRTVQWFKAARRKFRARLKRRKRNAVAAPEAIVPVKHGFYEPPAGEVWQNAWDVSEALVAEVAAKAKASGMDFLLVVYPTRQAVEAYAEGGFDYPEQRFRALAEAKGFRCRTLLEPYRVLEQQGRGVFIDELHLNAYGHAMTCDIVAQEMRDVLKD